MAEKAALYIGGKKVGEARNVRLESEHARQQVSSGARPSRGVITMDAVVPVDEGFSEFWRALHAEAVENAKRLAAELAQGIREHGIPYALARQIEWMQSECAEDFGHGWEIVDGAIAELIDEGLRALGWPVEGAC